MSRSKRLSPVLIATVLLVGGLNAQGPPPASGVPSDSLPQSLDGVRLEQRPGAVLPAGAAFVDDTGRPVRLGDYFGKRAVVLAFVYFDCPMLCSQVLQGLVRAIRALEFGAGREFDVVVISFDPSDDPADAAGARRTYARRYGRGAGGLHFLTGEPPAIDAATGAAGFHARYDADAALFVHPAAILVTTPDGRISRYLTGIDYTPRDLKLAIMEASASRIGSVTDRIQLYCYRYDPASGRYGLVVFRLLRLGALLTVCALGVLLAGTWWRERRKGQEGC